jgi:hypothetical protein
MYFWPDGQQGGRTGTNSQLVNRAAGQVQIARWSTGRQDRYYWPGCSTRCQDMYYWPNGQQGGRTGTIGLVAAGQVLMAWWSRKVQDRYQWHGGQQGGRKVLIACRSTRLHERDN